MITAEMLIQLRKATCDARESFLKNKLVRHVDEQVIRMYADGIMSAVDKTYQDVLVKAVNACVNATGFSPEALACMTLDDFLVLGELGFDFQSPGGMAALSKLSEETVSNTLRQFVICYKQFIEGTLASFETVSNDTNHVLKFVSLCLHSHPENFFILARGPMGMGASVVRCYTTNLQFEDMLEDFIVALQNTFKETPKDADYHRFHQLTHEVLFYLSCHQLYLNPSLVDSAEFEIKLNARIKGLVGDKDFNSIVVSDEQLAKLLPFLSALLDSMRPKAAAQLVKYFKLKFNMLRDDPFNAMLDEHLTPLLSQLEPEQLCDTLIELQISSGALEMMFENDRHKHLALKLGLKRVIPLLTLVSSNERKAHIFDSFFSAAVNPQGIKNAVALTSTVFETHNDGDIQIVRTCLLRPEYMLLRNAFMSQAISTPSTMSLDMLLSLFSKAALQMHLEALNVDVPTKPIHSIHQSLVTKKTISPIQHYVLKQFGELVLSKLTTLTVLDVGILYLRLVALNDPSLDTFISQLVAKIQNEYKFGVFFIELSNLVMAYEVNHDLPVARHRIPEEMLREAGEATRLMEHVAVKFKSMRSHTFKHMLKLIQLSESTYSDIIVMRLDNLKKGTNEFQARVDRFIASLEERPAVVSMPLSDHAVDALLKLSPHIDDPSIRSVLNKIKFLPAAIHGSKIPKVLAKKLLNETTAQAPEIAASEGSMTDVLKAETQSTEGLTPVMAAAIERIGQIDTQIQIFEGQITAVLEGSHVVESAVKETLLTLKRLYNNGIDYTHENKPDKRINIFLPVVMNLIRNVTKKVVHSRTDRCISEFDALSDLYVKCFHRSFYDDLKHVIDAGKDRCLNMDPCQPQANGKSYFDRVCDAPHELMPEFIHRLETYIMHQHPVVIVRLMRQVFSSDNAAHLRTRADIREILIRWSLQPEMKPYLVELVRWVFTPHMQPGRQHIVAINTFSEWYKDHFNLPYDCIRQVEHEKATQNEGEKNDDKTKFDTLLKFLQTTIYSLPVFIGFDEKRQPISCLYFDAHKALQAHIFGELRLFEPAVTLFLPLIQNCIDKLPREDATIFLNQLLDLNTPALRPVLEQVWCGGLDRYVKPTHDLIRKFYHQPEPFKNIQYVLAYLDRTKGDSEFVISLIIMHQHELSDDQIYDLMVLGGLDHSKRLSVIESHLKRRLTLDWNRFEEVMRRLTNEESPSSTENGFKKLETLFTFTYDMPGWIELNIIESLFVFDTVSFDFAVRHYHQARAQNVNVSLERVLKKVSQSSSVDQVTNKKMAFLVEQQNDIQLTALEWFTCMKRVPGLYDLKRSFILDAFSNLPPDSDVIEKLALWLFKLGAPEAYPTSLEAFKEISQAAFKGEWPTTPILDFINRILSEQSFSKGLLERLEIVRQACVSFDVGFSDETGETYPEALIRYNLISAQALVELLKKALDKGQIKAFTETQMNLYISHVLSDVDAAHAFAEMYLSYKFDITHRKQWAQIFQMLFKALVRAVPDTDAHTKIIALIDSLFLRCNDKNAAHDTLNVFEGLDASDLRCLATREVELLARLPSAFVASSNFLDLLVLHADITDVMYLNQPLLNVWLPHLKPNSETDFLYLLLGLIQPTPVIRNPKETRALIGHALLTSASARDTVLTWLAMLADDNNKSMLADVVITALKTQSTFESDILMLNLSGLTGFDADEKRLERIHCAMFAYKVLYNLSYLRHETYTPQAPNDALAIKAVYLMHIKREATLESFTICYSAAEKEKMRKGIKRQFPVVPKDTDSPETYQALRDLQAFFLSKTRKGETALSMIFGKHRDEKKERSNKQTHSMKRITVYGDKHFKGHTMWAASDPSSIVSLHAVAKTMFSDPVQAQLGLK